MNKVTIEIANLAKEAGFDWPCQYEWVAGGGDRTEECWAGMTNSNDDELTTAVPTQNQLRDWLYLEYGLTIAIEPDIDSDHNHLWAYLFDEYHQELSKGIVADYKSGITFMLRNGLKRVIGQKRVNL